MDILLSPLTFLFRTGSRIKNFLFALNLFKARKAPLPTISAGNITFGGSNKTPLAGYLVEFLRKQGFNPAFISRGYKGKWEKSGGILSDGKNIFGGWKDAGDEPFMMAQNVEGLGVFVGKDRLLSCKKARELGFDIAILDDGFQHRRLRKCVDIVIWRPEEKTALRESPRSLRRADIILVEECRFEKAEDSRFRKICPGKLFSYTVTSRGFFRLKDQKPVDLAEMKGRRILAMAGIARPSRFFTLLERLGVFPLATLSFPDHTSYPASAVEKILSRCGRLDVDVIVTTLKDSVKIKGIEKLSEKTICYLKIGLDIEEGFKREILRILRGERAEAE